jgi:hypothetical protein
VYHYEHPPACLFEIDRFAAYIQAGESDPVSGLSQDKSKYSAEKVYQIDVLEALIG